VSIMPDERSTGLIPNDAFLRHPELQARIADPMTSFFREFSVARLLQQFPEFERHRDWTFTDEIREANRARTLAGHCGDLWVFAYGSLMWDPALRFVEVRRARVPGYSRQLILVESRGGRGTAEAPGLMAALDEGGNCDGLVFRIAANEVDAETAILWRREVIAPGYIPAFVTAELDDGPVRALTFLADHTVADVRADLTWEEQVRCIAHGAGFLGSSRDYLANIVAHFAHLGIADDHCAELLRAVDAHLEAQVKPEPARRDYFRPGVSEQ